MLTQLKLRLDKQNRQLTESINYYNQTQTFLNNLVKSEQILHDVIYNGFKTSGVKKTLLMRFKKRNDIDHANSKFDDSAVINLMDEYKDDDSFKSAHSSPRKVDRSDESAALKKKL